MKPITHARVLRAAAIALGLLVAATPAAAAQIYKWKDDEGNVHYSSRKPPDAGSDAQTMTVNVPPPAASPPAPPVPDAGSSSRSGSSEMSMEQARAIARSRTAKPSERRAAKNRYMALCMERQSRTQCKKNVKPESRSRRQAAVTPGVSREDIRRQAIQHRAFCRRNRGNSSCSQIKW